LRQAKIAKVSVGDHIQAINGTDLNGCRHFEVAKILKEISIGSQFTMTLVEPKKAFGSYPFFAVRSVTLTLCRGDCAPWSPARCFWRRQGQRWPQDSPHEGWRQCPD
jgi:hypothetical protein